MRVRLGKNFLKMLPVYAYFAPEECTFTEEDAIEAYRIETYGIKPRPPVFKSKNGYYWGKQRLNLQVTSWMEDMEKGYIFFWELYEDMPEELHWWLDSVFKDKAKFAKRSRSLAEVIVWEGLLILEDE